ncbi:tektin-2-like isoform X2 [Aphis gossypii]|uniref:tektin-2-like isoform X2 n=1 Tax=Aphis gossypii TaxID=80765 RepID=UPI0021597689|nr:tektin-2-like isoform X2 [Aphis gossypii]
MSIVNFEKSQPKISEPDWYYKLTELRGACDKIRRSAFALEHESRRLRNETGLTTYWGTHRNNTNIANRQTEITRWKIKIELCLKHLQKEIEQMKIEKKECEKTIEFQNLNFAVTNHCSSLRDERVGEDLCYDIASIALKNEQLALEKLKTSLSEICQKAWEQINNLEELQMYIIRDIENKNNTIKIDSELLEMTKDSKNISLKPNPLRIPKDITNYENWLQQCENIMERIENELLGSEKLRGTMYLSRHRTKSDMIALNEKVNFGLRKRIYNTERSKYELEWQKENMLLDMATLEKEINSLGNALDAKLSSKMLNETRCEGMLYRDGIELCNDKPTLELHKENYQLNNSVKSMREKLDQTKAIHNILIEHLKIIEVQIVEQDSRVKCRPKMSTV